jgi:hypothetical protein
MLRNDAITSAVRPRSRGWPVGRSGRADGALRRRLGELTLVVREWLTSAPNPPPGREPAVNRNALNQNVFELSLRSGRRQTKAVLGGLWGLAKSGASRFGFPRLLTVQGRSWAGVKQCCKPRKSVPAAPCVWASWASE